MGEAALELLEGIDDEERVLEMPDVVRLCRDAVGNERALFHLAGETVLGFREAGDDAIAVDAESAGIIDQPEFNGEPVDARETLLDGRVSAVHGGLADLLVEVRELRMH